MMLKYYQVLPILTKFKQELLTLKYHGTTCITNSTKILQTALVHEPKHLGCLHYLIDAYDVPQVYIALQAVPFTHKYGQVASIVSHAQHMSVHIWTSYRLVLF